MKQKIIEIERLLEYLEELIACGALEFVRRLELNLENIYIPYMMSDAVEYYLILKECKVTGEMPERILEGTSVQSTENASKRGIILGLPDGRRVSLWFQKCEMVKTPYMRELAQLTWKKMCDLLTDKSNVQALIEQYLGEKELSGRDKEERRWELLLEYESNQKHIIKNLKCDVERIFQLYTECYADISMIFMLQPTSTEYILLYHQEQNWIDTHSAEGYRRYCELVQRIALILLAIPEEIFQRVVETDELSLMDKKLLEDAWNLAREIEEGEDTPRGYLPCCVLKQIYFYLKYSYGQLYEMYNEEQELQMIRKTFHTVTDDFSDATQAYRETIHQYEKEMQDNAFWKEMKLI